MDKFLDKLRELEKRIETLERKHMKNDLIACDFGDIIEEMRWTDKEDTSKSEFNVCGPPEFVKAYSEDLDEKGYSIVCSKDIKYVLDADGKRVRL